MVAATDRYALKNEMIAQSLERTVSVAAQHVINAFSGSLGNAVSPHSGHVDERQDHHDALLTSPSLDVVPAPTIPPSVPPPPVDVDGQHPDGVQAVFAYLDAIAALPRKSTTNTMWARHVPEAAYAFRLWASAHSYKVEEVSGRSLYIFDGWRILATLHFESEVSS